MSWNYYQRRDCPVCEGARKDCRQNTKTGLIHCRDLEANPTSYLFRGYDCLGFGMWADQVEADAWTEGKRQHWQEERQREREREVARFKRLLSDADRNSTIRAILNQLSLAPEHRTQLKRRGLSDEQIEARMYRSVEQWQRLEFTVTDRMAGVLRGGKGLNVPASGIICPIPNHQGQFVGWQIRFDEPGELPKYLWASCEKKRRQNGPSVHLRNGELPLAFFPPSSEPHEVVSWWFAQSSDRTIIPVLLTEGVAFKPALAAYRLGLHASGASGGHFASSPQTLKTYLEHIKAKYEKENQQPIVLQPILCDDAGCLDNHAILQVYANTFRQLKEFGYETKIAWWGQVDLHEGDIDEISSTTLASIRLLTCQDFFGLVKKTQRDRQIEAVQEGLQSLSYEPNVRLNARYLPDLTQIIPNQGIIALKSPKGSGKSVQIKNIIESVRAKRMKVISSTPRRALGREQSLKWGIDWGGDAEIVGLHRLTLLENFDALGLCWDSLWRLMERDWSNTLVIIDESELAAIHLMLSATCKDKRPLILRTLELKIQECLANNGMLLMADADLSDLTLNYFKALVSEAPVFLIVNDDQSPETRWQINFYTGKKDSAIAALIADLATPMGEPNEQGELVERQSRIIIATDSQDQAEALERYIQECYSQLLTVRIDSTTTETDEGREFVERPNEKILEIRPDILIYTPSMGAGVSIDVAWFDRMYGFFNGVIEPSQCRQMLARERHPIPRTIWCRQRGRVEGSSAFLPDEIKSHLFTFHRETNILIDVAKAIAGDEPSDYQIRQAYDSIWNPSQKSWDNPHIDLYCNLMARKNYGLFHLASQLRRQLVEEGHVIIDRDDGGNTNEGLRVAQIKKQLPWEEAQGIALDKDISLEEAMLLKQRPGVTLQQRYEIKKSLLSAELPGVELTPAFLYKAVTQDARRWLNAVKLGWYCDNRAKVSVMDRREWVDHLKKFSNGIVYLPDIRTYSLQVKVLHDLGLFEAIDLNALERQYSADSPAILRLLEKAKDNSRNLRLAFNLRVTAQSKPIQFVNRLLERVGLRLKFDRQETGGKRLYCLDTERLNDPDRLAVRESLTLKWADFDSTKETVQGFQPTWKSQQSPVLINNNGSCCDSVQSTHPISPSEPVSFFSSSEREGGSHVLSESEMAISNSLTQSEAEVVAESATEESQQSPVLINNNGNCCDSNQAAPSGCQQLTHNLIGVESLAVPLGNDRGWQVLQSDSKNHLDSSQQSPVFINNNGSYCDPNVQRDTANYLGDPRTDFLISHSTAFSSSEIPSEHQAEVKEMVEWLTEAVESTSEILKDQLTIVQEYIRNVPEAREWLWEALSESVKEAIAHSVPQYYNFLASEGVEPPDYLPIAEFWQSQQSPVLINDNGSCCEPAPVSSLATDELIRVEFETFNSMPSDYQPEIQSLIERLTEAAQQTSTELKEIATAAVESLQQVPSLRAALWLALTNYVKEAIARSCPESYQWLSQEVS